MGQLDRKVILLYMVLFLVACSRDDISIIERADRFLAFDEDRILTATLNTPDGAPITRKDTYVKNCSFQMIETTTDDILPTPEYLKIKGRGNSTWDLTPKKSYALKFDNKTSFWHLPADKSWVLLANALDKTMLRTDLASYIGNSISTLDFTPHFNFVWLKLNGEDKGLYQLGEKLKIASGRVDVGDDGYLLEIDFRAKNEDDARWFNVQHIEATINIKDPDVEYGDERFNYVKNKLAEADAALFSENFCDAKLGWRKYLDEESFVEWYLINEISKNADACAFYSSCFMNLSGGGKFKMGPVWDFDYAFGGYLTPENDFWANQPTGFAMQNNVDWYKRLFEDRVFVERVKLRFNEYYARKVNILERIDKKAALLSERVVEDNAIWENLAEKTAPQEGVLTKYMSEVAHMKQWIVTRLDWMKAEFDKM